MKNKSSYQNMTNLCKSMINLFTAKGTRIT